MYGDRNRVVELENYANSMSSGHLKAWKAAGMFMTFLTLVRGRDDKEHSLKWVKNCLEMEGFRAEDCAKINEWLWENVKNG